MDLVSGVTAARSSVHPGDGHRGRPAACASWPTTSASRRPWSSCSPRSGTVTVVPAGTAADDVLGARARRRVPLQRTGRPRGPAGPDRGRGRPGRSRARSSASASATRSWPPPWAASTYKLPFGHHGANHPVQRLETGVVEITSQNHNYAVAAAGSIPGAETTHVNLNDGVIEGFRSLHGPGVLGAVPPRGRPRPARRPLSLRRLPRPHAGPSHPFDRRRRRGALRRAGSSEMPRRDDLQSILVIGSGPIVIGQACEFDYSGTQACRVLRRGGVPGHPGQLQPGHDHDGPRDGATAPTSSRSTPRC